MGVFIVVCGRFLFGFVYGMADYLFFVFPRFFGERERERERERGTGIFDAPHAYCIKKCMGRLGEALVGKCRIQVFLSEAK